MTDLGIEEVPETITASGVIETLEGGFYGNRFNCIGAFKF